MKDVTLTGPDDKTVDVDILDGVLLKGLKSLGTGMQLTNRGTTAPIQIGENETFVVKLAPDDLLGTNTLQAPPSSSVAVHHAKPKKGGKI